MRGLYQKNSSVATSTQVESDIAFLQKCRLTWAALTKCVYERAKDILECAKHNHYTLQNEVTTRSVEMSDRDYNRMYATVSSREYNRIMARERT